MKNILITLLILEKRQVEIQVEVQPMMHPLDTVGGSRTRRDGVGNNVNQAE